MGGVILDSSVVIKAERAGWQVETLLEDIFERTGEANVGLTSIGVTELIHGIYRADSAERSDRRRLFLGALITDLPVFDYTLEIAHLAGRIDGEQTMRGNIIPFIDLLIGVTALHRGFPVLTTNTRHFRKIPGLQVIAY